MSAILLPESISAWYLASVKVCCAHPTWLGATKARGAKLGNPNLAAVHPTDTSKANEKRKQLASSHHADLAEIVGGDPAIQRYQPKRCDRQARVGRVKQGRCNLPTLRNGGLWHPCLTRVYGLLPIRKWDLFNRTLLRSVAVVYPALLKDMPPGLHGIRVLGAYRSSGFLAGRVIGFSPYRSDLLRHDCRVSRSQTWLGTRCLIVYK